MFMKVFKFLNTFTDEVFKLIFVDEIDDDDEFFVSESDYEQNN